MGLMSTFNIEYSHSRFPKVTIDPEDMRQTICRIPIFSSLVHDESALQQIIQITSCIKTFSKSTIIHEGSTGEEMYIVHSGAVEIKKLTRAGDEYTVVKLRADHNVFFGELALIDNDRRSATVTALMDSILFFITKKDFDALSRTHPEITLPVIGAIAKILAARLRKTTTDMLTIFDALVQELSE